MAKSERFVYRNGKMVAKEVTTTNGSSEKTEVYKASFRGLVRGTRVGRHIETIVKK